MYYIMEKYDSDTMGIQLRNINDWFSEEAYEQVIDVLEFKTRREAKKVIGALNIIFNARLKCSKLIIVTEIKTQRKPKDVTLKTILVHKGKSSNYAWLNQVIVVY